MNLTPLAAWDMARGRVPLERPVVVGILNITPDSFSDGGQYLDVGAAVAHAEVMVAAGAGMIDIGAESTRPGRPQPVSEQEEWNRLAPVVAELVRRMPATPLSVDTVKSGVARRALDAGVWAVNDVSGLRLDPSIASVCATTDAGLVLMHSRGTVTDMATYDRATYRDLPAEVVQELGESVRTAEARGVSSRRIVLDPGLGFAKTPEQSLLALSGLPLLARTGHPVMVGPSRKRFLGVAAGAEPGERDRATAAACAAAYALGASLFRVHAVAPAVAALAVAHAIRAA